MQLIEGRNLQDELQSGRKFDWREVCRIAIEICQGLKHAHDVGVIHRDLKPANLLITSEGTIKLTDFGIAKLYGMSHLTADGGVLGTADYMAPEQADGKQVTTRCDMYSLGSVLYALLARRPPFAAPTLPEVLHALKYDEAPPVRRFAPQTPIELESILTELLDKDPQKRIATPLVLSNRLKAMLHGLSEERGAAENEDEFELRLEDSQTPPLSHQTTIGSGEASDAMAHETSAPTPTRAMTQASARQSNSPKIQPSGPTRTFTVVDEKEVAEREKLPPIQDDGTSFWGMLAAAALLIGVVASLGWYFLRKPSADALYERIAAAAREDDPAALSNVEVQVDAFLVDHSADPRREEVAGYQQEIAIYRLQRKLELRARRIRGTDSLLPVEQAYLDAMGYERSAPEEAAHRLQSLIDLFGGDPSATPLTRNCVDLAKRQLRVLRERMARSGKEHQAVIAGRLEHARKMRTEAPETAVAICDGIVALYDDKPWAAKFVAEARQLLKELNASAPSP
jgi:serine/threonine-protein kinase